MLTTDAIDDTAFFGYVPCLQETVCEKKRQAEHTHRQIEEKYEATETAARLAEENSAKKQRYRAVTMLLHIPISSVTLPSILRVNRLEKQRRVQHRAFATIDT